MRALNIRTARAVIWFIRIEDNAMTEQRVRTLRRWLARPANYDAFESMRAVRNKAAPFKEDLISVLAAGDGSAAVEPGHAPQPAESKRRRNVNGDARQRLVTEEAAHWYFLCVDEPGMLRADRREFLAWMRRSPENIAGLFKIAQLDGKLRQLSLVMRSVGLTRSNVVELTTSDSPYGMHRWNRALDEREGRVAVSKRSRSFKLAAVAASVLIAVALGFVVPNDRQSGQVIKTDVSQWHHMMLPDGTAIHVDARSKIRVAYTEAQRIVHVYEGSAAFDVAKDPTRPFIARTHLIDATALGTTFGVSIAGGVTTTVSEGTVKVTGRAHPGDKQVTLNAGEELQVSDRSLTASRPAQVDAKRKLQWVSGMLDLSGLTVAQGIEELNRRNRVQILLESPTLGARVVKIASVKLDSPESYAAVIAETQGVSMVIDRDKRVIRLSEQTP